MNKEDWFGGFMKAVKDMHGVLYKKGWRDRKDAKWIKMPGVLRMCTYLKDRQDADVYINKKIDVTELVKYMKNKKINEPDTTYFHALSMACAKTIFNRPYLNRYIINHNCYERDNVSLSFVAKVDYSDEAKEFLSVIKIEPTDNINTLRDKIKEKVNKVRNNSQNATDNTVDILDKLPKPILGIVVPIVKWMDRHDFLPKNFNDNLIYNSTAILSNLGSIKCGAIYHNITNFGSNSILITFGDIHKEPMVINDKIEIRDVIDIGATLDERIADGVYMAKAINLIEYILKNPQTLEENANDKIKEKENFKY